MRSFLAKFNKKNLARVGFFSLLMTPLFFYYWLNFIIPIYIILILFLVWIFSIFLDMRITIQNRHLIINHEANIVFRSLYGKYSPVTAIIIQICIEICFVLLMPFCFHKTQYNLDFQSSSIISGIVTILHFVAWRYNKKTIKIIKNSDA